MTIGIDNPGRDIAHMTDKEIGEAALDAAEAAFGSLVSNWLTCGPNGAESLHMRVGVAVDGWFIQWAERVLGEGEQFAANTGQNGKAGTAAWYKMDSSQADRTSGVEIPDGPGRWPGGVFCAYATKLDDGTYRDLPAGVGASSGVQGDLDRVLSATAAYTLTGLVAQRYKARLAAGLSV